MEGKVRRQSHEIRLRLELMPDTGGKELIQWLMDKYPGQYTVGQTRTLPRRVAQWRQEQGSQEEKVRALMTATTQAPESYDITPSGIEARLNRRLAYNDAPSLA